ncbi:hypothetical protein LEP1GSC163_3534 [Leptospira santarosai str. CBC379]|nr:hypothetical protein LEP1GSC163_3534 [Leptospira santarosai str. CBC379]
MVVPLLLWLFEFSFSTKKRNLNRIFDAFFENSASFLCPLKEKIFDFYEVYLSFLLFYQMDNHLLNPKTTVVEIKFPYKSLLANII